ncbi:unnamed protein product [Cuscuta campestris]|uniref:Uncharacterized protein n=1 Tax=Cuscuta campestris TaxID=132261 RepID=A0A484LXB0_9ASTE|nr:unnamed protein product [Cuscuta campestris]
MDCRTTALFGGGNRRRPSLLRVRFTCMFDMLSGGCGGCALQRIIVRPRFEIMQIVPGFHCHGNSRLVSAGSFVFDHVKGCNAITLEEFSGIFLFSIGRRCPCRASPSKTPGPNRRSSVPVAVASLRLVAIVRPSCGRGSPDVGPVAVSASIAPIEFSDRRQSVAQRIKSKSPSLRRDRHRPAVNYRQILWSVVKVRRKELHSPLAILFCGSIL